MPAKVYIGEYIYKKNGVIITCGVHKYDSTWAFTSELPMDAVKTVYMPGSKPEILEWVKEVTTDEDVWEERFTLRQQVL